MPVPNRIPSWSSSRGNWLSRTLSLSVPKPPASTAFQQKANVHSAACGPTLSFFANSTHLAFRLDGAFFLPIFPTTDSWFFSLLWIHHSRLICSSPSPLVVSFWDYPNSRDVFPFPAPLPRCCLVHRSFRPSGVVCDYETNKSDVFQDLTGHSTFGRHDCVSSSN